MEIKRMLDTAQQLVDKTVTYNRITGQGSQNDPSNNTVIVNGAAVADETLAALFNGSSIARKVSTKLPKDALQKGFLLNMEDKDLSDQLMMLSDDYKVVPKFIEAASFARGFGGSAIILGIDDSQLPNKPLDLDKVKRLYSMDVVDKRYIFPVEWDYDMYSPTYGEPLIYNIQSIMGQKTWNTHVHRSRMIIFEGEFCTDDERLRRNSWWLSIFDIIINELNDYNNAFHQSTNLMSRATQAIFKVKGLIEQLSSINDKNVQDRWNVVDAFRSIYRAIVLDSDTEDFSYEEANVSGWDGLILKYQERLSAAVDMPLSVFLGMQPGGLSTINESDLRLWTGQVQSYQNFYVKPKLERMIKLLSISNKISLPDVWSVDFHSAYMPTPTEIYERRLKTSQLDSTYISAGVFTPDEVALFRSQEGGYDKDMRLDSDGKKIREISLNERRVNQIGQGL